MKETVIAILSLWGVLGYFYAVFSEKPKTRRSAFKQLLIIGPVGWCVFLIISASRL